MEKPNVSTPGLVVILLVTACFWGCSLAAAKYALAELAPLSLAALRFGISALLYLGLFFFMPATRARIAREDWWRLTGLAMLGVTLHFWVQYTVVAMTTATNASLVIATSPLSVAIISAVFFRERLTPMKALGFVVSYIGVILVVTRGSPSALWDTRYLLSNLIIILNAFCWAVFTVLSGPMTSRRNKISDSVGVSTSA